MARTVFVTGASGALGPNLLLELLRSDDIERVVVLLRPGRQSMARRLEELRSAMHVLANGDAGPSLEPRIHPISGDIRLDGLGLDDHASRALARDVDVVVHAAADTRFAAADRDLFDANVAGTWNVLAWARRCPGLSQFLFVSTACVAGTRTGSIPERLDDEPPAFVNGYERTKWQAEQLVASSGLPSRLVRLSTCLGDAETGYVHRLGAIHHTLRWLVRGLIPMVPGTAASRVDLIATDVAARWVARAVGRDVQQVEVCHVAAGREAAALDELLESAVGRLRAGLPVRSRRRIEAPIITDHETFELFRRSAALSGDLLFARVLEAANAFLPSLSYQKVYETSQAEALWGGPLPLSDWRATLSHVIELGSAHDWSLHRHADAGEPRRVQACAD